MANLNPSRRNHHAEHLGLADAAPVGRRKSNITAGRLRPARTYRVFERVYFSNGRAKMTLAMDIVDDDDASLEELEGAPFRSGRYVARTALMVA